MAAKEGKELPNRFASFITSGLYQDEVEILSVADFAMSAANSLFIGDDNESVDTKSTDSSYNEESEDDGKKYRVLVTAPRLPPSALALLQETCQLRFVDKNDSREVILKKAKECDAIFLTGKHFRVDKEFLNSFDSGYLKVVASMSNTFDNMDVIELSIRDVRVGVCRSVPAEAIAEVAIGHALNIAHRVTASADEILRKKTSGGRWLGKDIDGSIAGVVTMGPVGMALLCKLHGLNVSAVLYAGVRVLEVEQWAEYTDLESLVEQSDFIFETSELSKSNQKRFNEYLFKKMKPTAIFVNVGHGGVVDTDALTHVLQTRRIWGAGLDSVVPALGPEHPLQHADNCLISSHVGFSTEQTLDEMAAFTAFNILSGLEGEPMPSQVRFRLTPSQQRATILRRKITTTTLPRRYAARISLVADYKSSLAQAIA